MQRHRVLLRLLTHLNVGATLALAAWALASTVDGLDLAGILR